jgi:uncharacterized protein (TIGR02301 family)
MLRKLLLFAVAAALLGPAAPAAAQGPFPFFPFINVPRRSAPPPPRDLIAPPRSTLPHATRPARVPPAERAPGEPPRIEGAPPPYEAEMARLAEILGALHYLHPLCGATIGNRWRGEMEGLIEAEQPAAERRGRLIANFNRGYFTYEQTYRTCTPAAGLAIDRFLYEGARLSHEIATRYAY